LGTLLTHCINGFVGVHRRSDPSSRVSHGVCAPECRLHPIPAPTGLHPVHHRRPATDPIAANDHLRALQQERSHHCHHARAILLCTQLGQGAMGAMGQEGKSARRSGSGVSNHSDMGISAAIRRGGRDRLQKLDQHHYGGGAPSRLLEAAPARHFLDLRIRLGVAVTRRVRRTHRRPLGQVLRRSIERKWRRVVCQRGIA
jgi:hypothetical protein